MFSRTLVYLWSGLLLIVWWNGFAHSGEIRLFNGKNLDGWSFEVDEHSRQGRDAKLQDVFQVQKGVIAYRGYPYGVLQHDVSFQDYALPLSWAWTRSIAGTSAVFPIRASDDEADAS